MTKKKMVDKTDQVHLARRMASERRFKFSGLFAVLMAAGFLLLLLSTVLWDAIPAFTYHYAKLPFELSNQSLNSQDAAQVNYGKIYKKAVKKHFPFVDGRKEKRENLGIFSAGADIELRKLLLNNPALLNQK